MLANESPFDGWNPAEERNEHVYGEAQGERNLLYWRAADRIADMASCSPDEVPPDEVRRYIRNHYGAS